MRILIIHNHYGNYAVGGEAMVMKAEADLLRSHGHEVLVYERTNDEILRRGFWEGLKAFKNMCWSPEGYNAVAAQIEAFEPDIMHVHNYKFLLSPSIFKAAKDRCVATCLTLHNYRLICPAGQLLRDGKVCEDCINASPYRMIFYRCAFDSFVKNFAQFYLYHGTQKRHFLIPWVDAYIALTSFGKSKFVEGGLPENKVFVKPNFMVDPDPENNFQNRYGALYIGRISKEKGVETLLEAWRGINYPLKVIGDGPLASGLRAKASFNVKFHGPLEHGTCLGMIRKAAFLVFPSVCYEGFPLTILESLANGIPIIASDLGPRREMIKNGFNGFLYPSDNILILREKIRTLIDNPDLCKEMGENARDFYLANFTPEKNYSQLMAIYESAIAFSRQRN
jgi:glycosyltransferase involved in cell wall biosynthesis